MFGLWAEHDLDSIASETPLANPETIDFASIRDNSAELTADGEATVGDLVTCSKFSINISFQISVPDAPDYINRNFTLSLQTAGSDF